MARKHVVQVRLDDEEDAELTRLAKQLGYTKSEILRFGLEEARLRARRVEKRRRNAHLLLAAAHEVPGDDVWPEGRVWDEEGKRVR